MQALRAEGTLVQAVAEEQVKWLFSPFIRLQELLSASSDVEINCEFLYLLYRDTMFICPLRKGSCRQSSLKNWLISDTASDSFCASVKKQHEHTEWSRSSIN